MEGAEPGHERRLKKKQRRKMRMVMVKGETFHQVMLGGLSEYANLF